MIESVKLSSVGNSRIIEMNRPAFLNTLNGEMVEAMTDAIKSFEASEGCKVIVIIGAPRDGKPVYCAGGDVVSMAKGKGNHQTQMGFLAKEYALNHLIATCKKPIVALIDGVTSIKCLFSVLMTVVGGGAGVSVHGKFRVATENTIFAMPETAIGFIPDVGGTFFLSRLGALGIYLGLTGARLKGIDVYHARLATHYVPSNRLPDLKASLALGEQTDTTINHTLEAFSGEYQPFSLSPFMSSIEECFGKYEVREIMDSVKAKRDSSDPVISKWANETFDSLTKASPTALFLTHELLKRAKRQSLTSCLRSEYAVCYQILKGVYPDFYEGVEAKLIRKTNDPKWNPQNIESVSKTAIDRGIYDSEKESVRAQVTFTCNVDHDDMNRAFALPSDAEVTAAVQNKKTKELLQQYQSKLGLSELISKHF